MDYLLVAIVCFAAGAYVGQWVRAKFAAEAKAISDKLNPPAA